MNGNGFGAYPAARFARTLADAIDEHGAPNRFTPGFIAMEYGPRNATPMKYGRMASAICQILREHGYHVTYQRRAFVVDEGSAGTDRKGTNEATRP